MIALSLVAVISAMGAGWFGGQPPLGAQDERRHLFRPYSAVQLDYLGANYCENLLDMRLNTTSYTHQGFDSNKLDAWNLQFPDDAARIAEAFVWEDEYSGIARLETVRRFVLGMMAAHIPGTQGYHFFRHRSGGKTYLIFDDSAGAKEGRLLLSTWGDDIQGAVSVGFRALFDNAWLEQKDFSSTDTPDKAGSPAAARSPEYWNESPFVFVRDFEKRGQTPIYANQAKNNVGEDMAEMGVSPLFSVRFTGRYWLSDEDMPLEFAYESPKAEKLAIVVGEPGKPMPLMWDAKTPGIIDFGDRKTRWQSDTDGDQVVKAPACHYLVLHKSATWACPGYSSALLIMWDGQPESIEALAENGYGQIRVVYANSGAGTKGCVRLYPFHWVNEDDMEYVFRNAESFLDNGRLMHNGFPSQQLVNAIPSGFAAGAFLLTKYHDPLARTAQIEAANAVDAFLEPEHKGRRFVRLFFEVKAAAWMVKLAKLVGPISQSDLASRSDWEIGPTAEKYAAWVKLLMGRLLSPEGGYDGRAWGDGWSHFNNMKAAWLAYEATGNAAYREAYERAMDVYTIDKNGVYRNGEPLKAPGGFEVYAGALPMAAWGHWGLKDRVNQLINLQAPNGWHHPDIPVADLWNDAGAGPWSQDDAQPDMVGFMLRGYNIPTEPKHILRTGAFPKFTETGEFEATNAPIIDNPFFHAGPIAHSDKLGRSDWEIGPTEFKTIELDIAGQKQTPPCITQRVDVSGANGAALDIRMARGSYLVEVSPDGEHWFPRLNTWCDAPTTRSIDLSFLVGGQDELVRTLEFAPSADSPYLQSSSDSAVVRGHCRAITPQGNAVYKLALPRIDQCHIEFLLGNNYRIDLSKDGKEWTEVLSPGQITPAKDDNQKNAAWLRMVDATKYVVDGGAVYIRLRNGGNTETYGGAAAFLRRVAVYATYKSPEIHVRVKGAPYAKTPGFTAEWIRVRKW